MVTCKYLVPAGLDLRKMAPNESRLVIAYAYLLISYIIERRGTTVDRRKRYGEFVRIPRGRLRKIIPIRPLADVKRLLVRLGVLEMDSYQVGERPIGYRLRPPWSGRELVAAPAVEQKAVKRLRKARKARLRPILPEHDHLVSDLCGLEIDQAAAIERAREITAGNDDRFDAYLCAIGMIANRTWFFKPDHAGRCHTNLTLLPKKLRPYITFRGQRLVQVDVSAMQPFLMVGLMATVENLSNTSHYFLSSSSISPTSSHTIPTPLWCISKSLYRTLDLLQANKFYAEVRWAGRFHSTKAAKRAVVGWINDIEQKEKWRYYRTRLAVERICPEMAAFHDGFLHEKIAVGKRKKAFLSTLLQREESEWIMEVCGRLKKRFPHIPLWTIHDAVLTTAEYVALVDAAIKEVALERYGFAPHTKIEA